MMECRLPKKYVLRLAVIEIRLICNKKISLGRLSDRVSLGRLLSRIYKDQAV